MKTLRNLGLAGLIALAGCGKTITGKVLKEDFNGKNPYIIVQDDSGKKTTLTLVRKYTVKDSYATSGVLTHGTFTDDELTKLNELIVPGAIVSAQTYHNDEQGAVRNVSSVAYVQQDETELIRGRVIQDEDNMSLDNNHPFSYIIQVESGRNQRYELVFKKNFNWNDRNRLDELINKGDSITVEVPKKFNERALPYPSREVSRVLSVSKKV